MFTAEIWPNGVEEVMWSSQLFEHRLNDVCLCADHLGLAALCPVGDMYIVQSVICSPSPSYAARTDNKMF